MPTHRPTVGECVGGPADGVRLDPDDPEEPDDWPDTIGIGVRGGPAAVYRLRSWDPTDRPTERVYFFDFDPEG